MYNIAVVLSGYPQGIEITHKIFRLWKSHFKVNFHFYFSTWKIIPTDPPYKDLSYYNLFDKVSYESGVDIPFEVIKDNWSNQSTLYWSYLIHKGHNLRKQSQIKFDGVIHTSANAVVFYDYIESIVRLVKDGYNDNALYSVNGVINHRFRQHSKVREMGIDNPKFLFGSPGVMDKLGNLYLDVFLDEKVPKAKRIFHILPYEQMKINNIECSKLLNKEGNPFKSKEKIYCVRDNFGEDLPDYKKRYSNSVEFFHNNYDFNTVSLAEAIKVTSNPIY